MVKVHLGIIPRKEWSKLKKLKEEEIVEKINEELKDPLGIGKALEMTNLIKDLSTKKEVIKKIMTRSLEEGLPIFLNIAKVVYREVLKLEK